jgi:hypothetical protein
MTPRAAAPVPVRGGPLAMLVLLIAGWSAARAVLWENPFDVLPVLPDLPVATGVPLGPPGDRLVPDAPLASERAPSLTFPALAAPGWSAGTALPVQARLDPQLAAAHQLLLFAALATPLRRTEEDDPSSVSLALANTPRGEAPFLPAPRAPAAGLGRWSLDAWAFWRQGSDSAPVSQGRVPIYGASQLGAVLQYRLAPESPRDPRLYARAYRALVRRGESEGAIGASVRPVGQVPLRLAGELRYTDGAFRSAARPAAYAVTEIAPIALPLGARLEAYGQAGWVGGPGATAFADGQASVTREVPRLAALTDDALRLSLGAAVWGGAQKDAQRIDIGPTMRLDLRVGEVPARVSLDWRERVGGDAGPNSGLAATISTQF